MGRETRGVSNDTFTLIPTDQKSFCLRDGFSSQEFPDFLTFLSSLTRRPDSRAWVSDRAHRRSRWDAFSPVTFASPLQSKDVRAPSQS
jgi:hypothetical protein